MPSDPQSFFIDVPAGPAKQNFCSIFERPRGAGWAQETPYGIMLHESLVPDGLRGAVSLKSKDMEKYGSESGRWWHCQNRWYRPRVAVQAGERLFSTSAAADWLGSAFNDLKWVGMTADQVVRFIPKRLLVKQYEGMKDGQATTYVTLEGVLFKDVDIISALDGMSVQEFVDVDNREVG
jgi:hypothetical protein